MAHLPEQERCATLDVFRGAALMGAFFGSAIAYSFWHAAFFNLESPQTNGRIDWVVAVIGDLLLDQSALALLVMVFGAGLVLAADRAKTTSGTPVRQSLRRNLVLLVLFAPLGIHGVLWEGTPSWFLALVAPIVLLLRNRSPRVLFISGGMLMLLAADIPFEVQADITSEDELGQFWITGVHGSGDDVGFFLAASTFFRQLGSMLVGAGFGRRFIMRPTLFGPKQRRRMIGFGFGIGVPLAAAAIVWRVLDDFTATTAIAPEGLTTLASIPMAIGYAGVLASWAESANSWVRIATAAVGRLALSNSVLLVAFGMTVLRGGVFERGEFGRATVAAIVAAIWLVQLTASKAWLDRFYLGPLEWLLRLATYLERPTPFQRRPE